MDILHGQKRSRTGAGGSQGAAAAPATALDPNERLATEQALRLSEHSYRLLIEEAPYAICRATETGQLLQVNGAMIEMLGYPRDSEADLLMRDLPLIFAAKDGFDKFRQSLLNGDVVQGFESAWLRGDGRQIQVRIGARRVHGPAGETFYFELLAENVTERKELEARLVQAEKMQAIGQLAGGIAHDFNNLLTVINGYCDLLLAEEDVGSRRRSLDMIRRAGERAAGLTQQLLAFSRKQVTRREAIHLNAIVSEVVQLSGRLIGENIRVLEDLCTGADTVLADAAQIHQALMNLVINARDAMPDGGLLGIATSTAEAGAELAGQLDIAPGEYVVLSVSDSGLGMDDFVRAHLFEPFFTTKATGAGTGLGLATVYGTVRQSRGGIAVESQPGTGSTFRIYLPRFVPDAASMEPGARPQTPAAGTVLVVEDDEAVRGFIADLLRGGGYEVLEATDARSAIAAAGEHRGAIHLLLTDMAPSGLNGRKFAEELRGLHPESGIRYLKKPFTPEQLTRMVREAISEEA